MSNKSALVGASGLERGREWLGGFFLRLMTLDGGLALAEKIVGCGCARDLNMPLRMAFSSLCLFLFRLTLSVLIALLNEPALFMLLLLLALAHVMLALLRPKREVCA